MKHITNNEGGGEHGVNYQDDYAITVPTTVPNKCGKFMTKYHKMTSVMLDRHCGGKGGFVRNIGRSLYVICQIYAFNAFLYALHLLDPYWRLSDSLSD